MLKSLFRKKTSQNPALSAYVKQYFGFVPRKVELYEQALRHSSVAVRENGGIKNSNERLEYLGDAVIDCIVADYLYSNYPNKTEGDLTKMKAKIVSRRNLNAMGVDVKLPEHLDLNLGGQEVHQSIVGNAFEAMVGAIYLDKGFNFTETVLIKLLKKHGLSLKIHMDSDYKSKLHEWCQKEKRSLGFRVLHEEQDAGKTRYVVAVTIDGAEKGMGEGKSKKSAEQLAAQQACMSIFGVK